MVKDAPEESGDEHGLVSEAAKKDAWSQTLEDMTALADEYEAEGWETIRVHVGQVGCESVDVGESDRFGFVHVVPGDKADAIEAAVEDAGFPQFDVYRKEVEGTVFFVLVLLDPATETAVFIAASYKLGDAEGVAVAAEREGVVFSHLQRLDGTHVASFEHEAYEKFFPDIDRLLPEE
ncbi:DUF7529 family protein [Halocalculus aciditolerans]|uniref:Uncharacterized protein n=1 Tax=Halocalculus aciditolerans TaxID=1383812 RepID=A0A830EZE0_9EURY|nr:hypothetical protein [Halocalculus aciditolerans]GGL47289.1 hypothetical protein GCM10009039_01990 [Halocalculus aciditolerans]